MKVTIDTQTDSMDDIKKVVHLLTHMLEVKGQAAQTIISSTPPVDTASMMTMFSDEEVPAPKEVANTPPDLSAFRNLTQGKTVAPIKRSSDLPNIEFY